MANLLSWGKKELQKGISTVEHVVAPPNARPTSPVAPPARLQLQTRPVPAPQSAPAPSLSITPPTFRPIAPPPVTTPGNPMGDAVSHIAGGLISPVTNSLGLAGNDVKLLSARLTHNKTAQANATAAGEKNLGGLISAGRQFTRAVPEAFATLTGKQTTYHPGSKLEQEIFGKTPVQNIEANVAHNYDTHKNLNPLERLGLAGADAGGQVLNVLPAVGATGKLIKLGKEGADTAKLATVARGGSLESGFVGSSKAADFKTAEKAGQTFNTVDDKPRFEVSDEGAKARPMMSVKGTSTQRLGNILDHPKLYQNYPFLKDVPVEFTTKRALRGASAGFSKSRGLILLDKSMSVADKTSSLLHEAQHAIQNHEDLQSGGNYSKASQVAADRIRNMPEGTIRNTGTIASLEMRANLQLRHLRDAGESPIVKSDDGTISNEADISAKNKPLLDAYKKTIKQWNAEYEKPSRQLILHKAYQDIYGEAEARTVQKRASLSDSERKARPFMQDFDAKPEDVVTRKPDGVFRPANPEEVASIKKATEPLAKDEPKPIPKKQTPQKPLETPKITPKTTKTPEKVDLPKAPVQKTRPPKAPLDEPKTPTLRRGVVKTAKRSEEVSAPVKKLVKGEYERATLDGALEGSGKLLTKGLAKATEKVNSDLASKEVSGAQETSDAIAVAKAHDAKGNWQTAADIYNRLAEKLTKQGQGNAAVRLLSRRSPEGIRNSAMKALKDGKADITPKLQKDVQDITDRIRKAAPDSQARDDALQDMRKLVSQNIHHSLGEKAFALFRTGLLTGPQTASKVLLSHGVLNTAEKIKDVPAVAIDKSISATSKLLGKGGRRSTALTARGLGKGASEGAKAGLRLLATGHDTMGTGGFGSENIGELGHPDVSFGKSAAGRAADFYVQKVGQVHAAIPKAFFSSAQANDLFKQAIASAKNAGLHGKAYEAHIQEFVADATDAVKQEAELAAQKATFQQHTLLGNQASRARVVPGFKWIAPFARVASAILTDAVDYSPVGAVKTVVSAIKDSGEKGWTPTVQKHFVEGLGRSITGTGAALIGYTLYKKGLMTLGYPTDPTQQAIWKQEGKQENSIKINGKWRSTAALGPAGTDLAAGGYFAQGGESKVKGGKDVKQTTDALQGMLTNITGQSYLSGATALSGALQNPTENAGSFAKNTARSLVPIGIQTIAKATDKTQRQTPGVLDTIKGGIPGLRETLQPSTAPFGGTLKRQGSVAANIVDPTRPSGNGNDPVTNELDRLATSVGTAGSGMPLPVKSFTATDSQGNKQSVAPTTAQKNAITNDAGPKMQSVMKTIINDPRYKNLSDEQKQTILNYPSTDYTTVAEANLASKLNGGMLVDLTKDQKTIANGGTVDYFAKLGASSSASPSGPTQTTTAKSGALISTASTDTSVASRKATYQIALQKYQSGVKDGSISQIQQSIQAPKLARQAITSNFDQDVVSLYGQSATAIRDYLADNPSSKTASQLQSLDSDLLNAGVISKSKFGKNGSATTASSGSGSSKFKKQTTSKSDITSAVAINKLLAKSTVKAKKVTASTPKLKVAQLKNLKVRNVA